MRPLCFSNFPFMVQLIYKEGEYYQAISDWNKVSNIDMLNKEVDFLYRWVAEEYDLGGTRLQKKNIV